MWYRYLLGPLNLRALDEGAGQLHSVSKAKSRHRKHTNFTIGFESQKVKYFHWIVMEMGMLALKAHVFMKTPASQDDLRKVVGAKYRNIKQCPEYFCKFCSYFVQLTCVLS